MYPARRSNAIEEEKAIEIFGKEIVEKVKSIPCDFTNRVIDECYDVFEMFASIEHNDYHLNIFYLIPNICSIEEDMGNWDYSNFYFTFF